MIGGEPVNAVVYHQSEQQGTQVAAITGLLIGQQEILHSYIVQFSFCGSKTLTVKRLLDKD